MLDFCFGNDRCGRHGRCVNNLAGFKCSCYFWREGPFCQKCNKYFSFKTNRRICLLSHLLVSTLAIQFLIGLFLILIFLILSIGRCQNYQKRAMENLEKFVYNLTLSDNTFVSFLIGIIERHPCVLLL